MAIEAKFLHGYLISEDEDTCFSEYDISCHIHKCTAALLTELEEELAQETAGGNGTPISDILLVFTISRVSNSEKDNNADDEEKSKLEKKRKKLEKKRKRKLEKRKKQKQNKMKLNRGNETKVEMQKRAASLAFVSCSLCVYVQEVH